MDYERLVARHKDSVYRQMVRACGNYDDAEDVLVEALLSAYRASDKLRDEAAFRAWLAVIGRRVCSKLKSKRALEPVFTLAEVPESALQADAEDQVETDFVKSCVKDALETLSPIYREVYVGRELEGKPAAAVAKELHLSLAAVKSRLLRARKMVRDHLDESLCFQP